MEADQPLMVLQEGMAMRVSFQLLPQLALHRE
jgi:hypothetical protein